jgi:hypothetical protein
LAAVTGDISFNEMYSTNRLLGAAYFLFFFFFAFFLLLNMLLGKKKKTDRMCEKQSNLILSLSLSLFCFDASNNIKNKTAIMNDSYYVIRSEKTVCELSLPQLFWATLYIYLYLLDYELFLIFVLGLR